MNDLSAETREGIEALAARLADPEVQRVLARMPPSVRELLDGLGQVEDPGAALWRRVERRSGQDPQALLGALGDAADTLEGAWDDVEEAVLEEGAGLLAPLVALRHDLRAATVNEGDPLAHVLRASLDALTKALPEDATRAALSEVLGTTGLLEDAALAVGAAASPRELERLGARLERRLAKLEAASSELRPLRLAAALEPVAAALRAGPEAETPEQASRLALAGAVLAEIAWMGGGSGAEDRPDAAWEEALERAEAAQDLRAARLAGSRLLAVAVDGDDWGRASMLAERMARAEPPLDAAAMADAVGFAIRAGDVERAQTLVDATREGTPGPRLVLMDATLADARGQSARVLELGAALLADADATSLRGDACRLMASAAVQAGDREGALSHLEQARSHALETGDAVLYSTSAVAAVELLDGLGRRGPALELLIRSRNTIARELGEGPARAFEPIAATLQERWGAAVWAAHLEALRAR